MGITHVVRGQEWISSTPKHLLLYRWLGLTPPKFAHMPLLRDEKKAKISKRKNPWARLTWFKEQGYLPEALVNFLALQGYPPIVEADGTEREVFSFAEFTERFRWEDVNRAGAIFDLDKLDWLNGVYIRGLEVRDFTSRLLPYLEADGVLSGSPSLGELGRLMAVAELIQTRIGKLSEATPLVRPFFVGDDQIEIADDARAQLNDDSAAVLDAAVRALGDIDDHPRGLLGSESGWSLRRSRALCARRSWTGWGSSRSSRSGRCGPPCRASGCRRRCSSRWRSWARRPRWPGSTRCAPRSDLGAGAEDR